MEHMNWAIDNLQDRMKKTEEERKKELCNWVKNPLTPVEVEIN